MHVCILKPKNAVKATLHVYLKVENLLKNYNGEIKRKSEKEIIDQYLLMKVHIRVKVM